MAQKLVTLLGVPGSGKSTLYARLTKSRFVAFERAQAYSLGRWMIAEKIRLPVPSLLFRSKFFLHYYLARYVSNISNLDAQYSEALCLFSTRIATGLLSGHINSRMYMEFNCFTYDALSRLALSEKFPDPFDLVLQDEGWLNLALVTLNWGDRHEWQSWLADVLSALPPPSQIVWLYGAAELSEERQRQRNRFATMYLGQRPIGELARAVESGIEMALPLLERHGIVISQVNANMSAHEVESLTTRLIAPAN